MGYRVLSIGDVEELLEKRNLALTAAGYRVTSVRGGEPLRGPLGRYVFDAVVMGYAVSEARRHEIIRELRAAGQNPAVVLLYNGRIVNTEEADAIINVHADPQDLVNTVRHVLERRGQRSASQAS